MNFSMLKLSGVKLVVNNLRKDEFFLKADQVLREECEGFLDDLLVVLGELEGLGYTRVPAPVVIIWRETVMKLVMIRYGEFESDEQARLTDHLKYVRERLKWEVEGISVDKVPQKQIAPPQMKKGKG